MPLRQRALLTVAAFSASLALAAAPTAVSACPACDTRPLVWAAVFDGTFSARLGMLLLPLVAVSVLVGVAHRVSGRAPRGKAR